MTPISGPPKASFQLSMLIYDTRFRSYTFQFIALILLMLLIGYLGANLMRNLSDQGQEYLVRFPDFSGKLRHQSAAHRI